MPVPQPSPPGRRRAARRFIFPILALLLCVGIARAAEPESSSATTNTANAPAAAKPAPPPANATEGAAAPSATASAQSADPNLVTMNFHSAPLDQVLDHLSQSAGFIINVKPGTTIRGKVEAYSSQPMTKEEALNLLNTALHQNGLAAIRNGRTLTIVNEDIAKTLNIRVIQGSDPDKIPMTDEIVTQIMPVRFVEAAQLVKDLQPLVSLQTTMTANEAGNSIVMTDTQATIHKVAEIIKAIDMGAEDFVEVKVFHLTNASPVEMAELLSNLFPDESKSGSGATSQSPFAGRFGRFFGGGGGPGGGGGLASLLGGGGAPGAGGSSGNQNQRIKKRNRVIAVPDQRTTSIIVSATRDLMEQITDVVGDLDASHSGTPMVRVIQLQNADPQEAQTVLQEIFPNTTSNSRNQQNQNNVLMNRSTTQGSTTSQSGSTSSRTTGAGGGSRGGGATPFGP